MHVRGFSVALVTAAVASGAYYYRAAQQQVVKDSPLAQTQSFSTANYPTADSTASSLASAAQEAAETTRRALVIDKGELFSGTLVGDGPLSKDTDDYGRKVLEMLTPDQATEKLRKRQESWLVGRGQGVVRYDIVQIPSNDPIEDDYAHKIVEVPATAATPQPVANDDWMFWGVFDGHSGWTTSARLRQSLISFVMRELNTTFSSARSNTTNMLPTPEAIDAAIKSGFVRLDNEIVIESVKKVQAAKSKAAAAEILAPALSGSCALLSFYDTRSKQLRVACTGDSRAVLGRRAASGKWTAQALSVDQTGGNIDEANRMRAEHPGEPNVIHNGRVLGGLEPTRAFGDSTYKWDRETQAKIKESYFGRTPSNALRSPPYVTAEPVVTTTKVQPENGDFVVMATDGLWEMLTNEEVVGLVGQWLETEGSSLNKSAKNSSGSWVKSFLSGGKDAKHLPVESASKKAEGGGYGYNDKEGQRVPLRQGQWGLPGVDQRFVVKDKNVATHLVRNALGGKDEDQLCALLTLPSPYSRRYRYVDLSFQTSNDMLTWIVGMI